MKFILAFVIALLGFGRCYSQESLITEECQCCVRLFDNPESGLRSFTGTGKFLIRKAAPSKDSIDILNLLYRNRTFLIMTISAPALKCIEPGDKIYLKAANGFTMSLVHDGDQNCTGNFRVLFYKTSTTRDQLSMLVSTPFTSIRLSSSAGSIEMPMSTAQSYRLLKEMSCLKKMLRLQE